MVYKSSKALAAGAGSVTQINTGTGLTGGPITTSGTISVEDGDPNSLAGFDNTGEFAGVEVGSGLDLTAGVLTATGGGTGTVTQVSVVSANGFAGTVANDTTTPAITLTTTVTGILSGNGTAISAASTTGSGAIVLATSPTLVTPALGTPTALVGTNITGTAAGLTAGNVTTNANLTGPITSVGNATSVAAQTGTGSIFVMNTSPTLVTPNIGVAAGTSLDVSGVLESGTNSGTGGQLKLFGSTSGDATIKVAAAAGTATVFQLPADNGTNTYVLQTNGSGVTSWVAPAAGTVTSVSGTSNRITSTGGATPVIDIAATYVGQSSITTVGTLTGGATGTGFTVSLTNSTISGNLSVNNLNSGTNAANTTWWRGDGTWAALGTAVTGVTSAGSNQGTATALTGGGGFVLYEVTTVGSGEGVLLPAATAYRRVYIVNRGANALLVYPASGDVVNGQAANAAFTLPVKSGILFVAEDTTSWYTESFQGGDVATTDASASLTVNKIQGTVVSGTTGSVNVVFSTSPTLTTPILGVATGTSLDVSGVLESGANGGTGGQLKMFGSTSGDVTLKVAAAAGTATVFQLPADNGTNTYVLQTNGSGVTSWAPAGSGTIGGSTGSTDNAILRADGTGGATLQASPVLIADSTGVISGTQGVTFTGSSSGTTALVPTAAASGTLTLPAATDTLVGKATTDELTNKTLNASVGKGTWTASGTWTLPAWTMGGNVQMAENVSFILDAALSADGKYCGITEAGTAGTTLVFGDLIYLAVADSRWELADASAVSTAGMRIGICVLAAASDGSATTILTYGKIRADSVFPTLTVGAPVYISETSGDITNTAPTTTDSVTRVVGFGNTGDELFFSPSNDYITHV